jgi:hypothetical protein
MHKDLEDIELRSEEVQEILGTPPGWLARWGTLAALTGVVVLGWVGFWLELPETIDAEIKITSKDPPRRFFAPGTTVLKEVFVGHESLVDSGKIVLLFNSKARLGHVLSLEADILRIESDQQITEMEPRRDLLLGEIQEDYYDFLEKWEQYKMVSSRKLDAFGRRDMQKRIKELEYSIEEQENRKEQLQRQLEEVDARYNKELALLKRGFLTREELNPTRTEKEKLERDIQDMESDIRTKNFQITSLRDKSKSSSGRAKALQDANISFNLLKDSFARLANRIAEWKREYLVESPVNGTVLFARDNLIQGQFVQRDSLLLVILPKKTSGMAGQLELAPEDAGLVNQGQKVQVKLFDFPFTDFGAAWGEVKSKGKIPVNGKVPVEISFPGDTLTTSKMGRIHPEGELRGRATIVMAERRLIQRLFGIPGKN